MLLFVVVSNSVHADGHFIRTSDNGDLVIDLEYLENCQKTYNGAQYNYIPNQIRSADTSDLVLREVLNHNVKNLLSGALSEGAKKQVAAVSEGVKSDYSPIEGHKVSFKFEAIQARTQLVYRGAVDARVSMRVDNGELNMELTKSIYRQAQIVFTHNGTQNLQTDLLAIRYSF